MKQAVRKRWACVSPLCLIDVMMSLQLLDEGHIGAGRISSFASAVKSRGSAPEAVRQAQYIRPMLWPPVDFVRSTAVPKCQSEACESMKAREAVERELKGGCLEL